MSRRNGRRRGRPTYQYVAAGVGGVTVTAAANFNNPLTKPDYNPIITAADMDVPTIDGAKTALNFSAYRAAEYFSDPPARILAFSGTDHANAQGFTAILTANDPEGTFALEKKILGGEERETPRLHKAADGTPILTFQKENYGGGTWNGKLKQATFYATQTPGHDDGLHWTEQGIFIDPDDAPNGGNHTGYAVFAEDNDAQGYLLRAFSKTEGGGAKRTGLWESRTGMDKMTPVHDMSQHAADLGTMTSVGTPLDYPASGAPEVTPNGSDRSHRHFDFSSHCTLFQRNDTWYCVGRMGGGDLPVVLCLLTPQVAGDWTKWEIVEYDMFAATEGYEAFTDPHVGVNGHYQDADRTLIYLSFDHTRFGVYEMEGSARAALDPFDAASVAPTVSATTADSVTFDVGSLPAGATGVEWQVGDTKSIGAAGETTYSATGLSAGESVSLTARPYKTDVDGLGHRYGVRSDVVSGQADTGSGLPQANLVQSVDPARAFIGDGSDLVAYTPSGDSFYTEIVCDVPATASKWLWAEGSNSTTGTSPHPKNTLLGIAVAGTGNVTFFLNGQSTEEADKVTWNSTVTPDGSALRFVCEFDNSDDSYAFAIYDINDTLLDSQTGTHPRPDWVREGGRFGAQYKQNAAALFFASSKYAAATYSAVPDASTKTQITTALKDLYSNPN